MITKEGAIKVSVKAVPTDIKELFNNYDSNIRLLFIAPCKVITLNPLSILFGISSLLLFLMALSIKLSLFQLSR